MSRWFRAYADAHRNPKVVKLTDRQFRLWHSLMCVAAENEGVIPPLDDLKCILKTRLDHLSTGVEALIKGGLIDRLDAGYTPHNWSKRQYKSDTSTDRVQKFREKRNVSETPPETDTETEVTVAKATGANSAANDSESQFWASAKDYIGAESKSAGSLIGKWRRDHGKERTAEAITRAQLERPMQRIPFIEGTLRSIRKTAVQPVWDGMP